MSVPPEFAAVMVVFQPLFSKSVFEHARWLVVGTLLTPGRRTVASALRTIGRSHLPSFQNYHRVLSRARWSPRHAAEALLTQLVATFASDDADNATQEPLVFAIDDTIERRWGPKIKARGIYRDPVRSSRGHFVKASGLRWLSLQYLPKISWAGRVWALPCLTVLCPSERYHQARGLRHKKLTDWARQMILQLKRWLPDRRLVVTADSSFAAIELLAAVGADVTVVTRLRLDAALYAPAPPRVPGRPGRPAKKGARLPTLKQVLADTATPWQRFEVSQWYGQTAYTVEIATGTAVWYHSGMPVVPLRWVLVRDPAGKLKPKAFLSTDQAASAIEIVQWFVRRWSVEVTFAEVRRHLGFETQRQWSDRAIERTTPCLLGLFSVVALVADALAREGRLPVARAAWYPKSWPTFSDALAGVRLLLWRKLDFCSDASADLSNDLSISRPETEILKIPKPLFERLTSTLAYAA